MFKMFSQKDNKPMTQKEEVLLWLRECGTISTIEASNKLFIADLQSVIRELRKTHKFSRKWIHRTNKYGRPCKYMRYKFTEPRDERLGYTPYGD